MTKEKGIRIGLAGLGTVGQGVWKHLRSRKSELELRMGTTFSLEKAAVRDMAKKRGIRISKKVLTNDPMSVAVDPEIEMLVIRRCP